MTIRGDGSASNSLVVLALPNPVHKQASRLLAGIIQAKRGRRKRSMRETLLCSGAITAGRSAIQHRHRVDLNSRYDGNPRFIGLLLTSYRLIPSSTTDFVRDDQHH